MDTALSHLLWVFLMLLPLSALTQTTPTINLGTFLSTDQNSSWVSPSGEFAFGFHPLQGTNLFLLGISFNKIPEKTIVWSANGYDPVEEGSRVELTVDGQLVLNNHRGQEIWKAEPNDTVTSAAMLDTGNFVLMGSGSVSRWDSFSRPTDTILPTQILGPSSTLSSRELENNYSSGKFRLTLKNGGNLQLYTVALPSENTYGAYWESDTGGNGTQVVFNQTGYVYISLQNGSRFNLTQGNIVSTRDFYMRATLDYDGVFRQYVYQKNHSDSGLWAKSWSPVLSVPQDICMAKPVDIGGACGFNSYCKLDDSNQRPSCLCPTGYYTYLDKNNTFKGCKPDFAPQSCGADDSVEETQFEMDVILNTDWPLSDYEHYTGMDENQCRAVCLEDCFCAVAIYRNGGDCWKKKLPLSNGRMDPQVDRKALIKVRKGNSTSPWAPTDSSRGKNNQGIILIISVILGSSGFLNFLLSAILLAIYFSSHKKVMKLHTDSSLIGINLRGFTYKELEGITNGFKEELGSGSCGTVYKGIITSDSVNFVAVKKLDRVVKEAEKEFKNEVRAIGRIHHKNLVQLLGYCEEGSNRLLVYEFMSNGSLANFLFNDPRPDWNQRTQIAFGIARGLMYLHEECSNQIIHCDIKPQNILLDNRFTARISDFGLAKLLKTNQTRTTTNIRGTKGYVAPEWFKNIAVTAKVDVYSFGVMLLEIICCRKCIEPELENEANTILTDWVCDCYKEGRVDMLVANDEDALNDARRLERMVMVAIWCIQEDPSLRPSMKKVTQMLEGAVEVAVPPDPYSFISSLG